MICKALPCLCRVVFRRMSVPSHCIMRIYRFSAFVRRSSLHRSLLCQTLCYRRLHLWTHGVRIHQCFRPPLALSVGLYRRCHTGAPFDFALGCLKLVPDNCSLFPDGVTFVALIGVCIVGKIGSCSINGYCIRYADFIHGQRKVLDNNHVIESICPW